ncbi:SAM-dependent methyltransferase [Amycolatopsis thailandensis]|uniref:site-specific DNA-methyltransferase (adenine-specific) n=1 Tax=Amycolatopsis thailandensis TaxID=589330 RepID=A0A229SFV1_9PSEU|nr:DNA methyltransferase [Amycolatopsis thailandensis]OXM57776.1 SAM-dependent methyltransferase [Amycolatopsis thailandensis]
MRLNLKSVEERVAPLGGRSSYDREFIFQLLMAYGKPQGNVTRLRKGSLNVADNPETEVAQKNVVYFKETTDNPLAVIDELKTAPTVVRYSTRFVIVTDYAELLAVDTKTGENLMIPIQDINQHFTFFLPWAGMEKAQYIAEAHADVKAAERMGRLFDELLAANPYLLDLPHGRHGLNVFFTRLLFCFFAEDTGIFEENQFTNAVGSQTQADGSDVAEFLTDLFAALDTAESSDKPRYLTGFPYVNGRLFKMTPDDVVPTFTKKARKQLIESGSLIWRGINPDIFGSMFQAIVTPGKRSDLGQHYTSVPNILKTIEPLFLDELKEQLDTGFDSVKKLERLLERISEIKVFDPACGSGNFLVIAYKELRKLEHAILERLADLDPKHQVLFAESKINIESFYGIEIDDFAVEVAILSLWIAKHQMNAEFKEKFNVSIPLIPLKETGQIHAGNATRTDWNSACPNDGQTEIFLIGNPPYVGSSMQSGDQKAEFPVVFGHRPFSRNLDYIALWFVKGADYIRGTRSKLAFVTTNSAAQGDHVGLMFPSVLTDGIEIGFAYTSFKWENNAKRNAGVTVAVISLRNQSTASKYLYADDLKIEAKNINGYLADGPTVIIARRSSPLGVALPRMIRGSQPSDGGHLILDPAERNALLASAPETASFVKRYMGSSEFINDGERYCLWVEPEDASKAMSTPALAPRLRQVADFRRDRNDKTTRDLADKPWQFKQPAYRPTESIMVPSISSGRRDYIPIGYLDADTVVSNKGYAVYDAQPWLFAILTSRVHMAWVNAVSGRMREDYQYSNTIVYNNFPVPPLSESAKEQLTFAGLRVLDVREYHCEKTLAELYDPDLMLTDLRQAHAEVDALVDSIYSKRGYETDEQRLSDLFAMYEAMTAEEAAKAPTKKTRGARK